MPGRAVNLAGRVRRIEFQMGVGQGESEQNLKVRLACQELIRDIRATIERKAAAEGMTPEEWERVHLPAIEADMARR